MLSKQRQKYILSLHNKKYRQINNEFLVEGKKSINELTKSNFIIKHIYLTESAVKNEQNLPKFQYEIINDNELKKITTLKANDYGLAIVEQKENKPLFPLKNEFILVLDDLKDPGNFGTIIRTADWYGITKIVCSLDTVEFYNPKVIMSTMGSFTRIECFYTNLFDYFKDQKEPIIGAFIDGKSIYEFNFPNSGFIVIGSESHGINNSLDTYISNKITIPKFGNAESLNAAIATGIILDNLKRY